MLCRNHSPLSPLSLRKDNMSMHYTDFKAVKIIDKKNDTFLIFAQNIECGYS